MPRSSLCPPAPWAQTKTSAAAALTQLESRLAQDEARTLDVGRRLARGDDVGELALQAPVAGVEQRELLLRAQFHRFAIEAIAADAELLRQARPAVAEKVLLVEQADGGETAPAGGAGARAGGGRRG